MIARLGFLLLCLFLAAPACADDYITPELDNLTRTLVRFGAINLSDADLLDEYAMITDCDIYQRFFGDDFKWNKVRGLIRDSVRANISTFPISYHYDAKLKLDRYDFNEKVFSFSDETSVHNINAFTILHRDESKCGKARIHYLPLYYRTVLDSPVTVPGLPLSEPDARALLKRMNDDKNTERAIYARFNLRVVYIEPLRRENTDNGVQYTQTGQAVNSRGMHLDARLDSADFYEDPAMTKLIYSYRP
jgi:hypothetical protein